MLDDGQRPCRSGIIVITQQRIFQRPSSALARKLANVLALSSSDRDALDSLGWNTRSIRSRANVINDGDTPVGVNLIMSGWACRYKVLGDGSRQITAILLPGDFCDLHVTMLTKMDHGIATLSPVSVARVGRHEIDAIRLERPSISLGFDWMTMVDLGTLRAWITSLGQQRAIGRVAHLLCELHQRTLNIGEATPSSFDCYMTQGEIAEATGQTSVHVNRVFRELRSGGLALLDRKLATILDPDKLRQVGNFDPSYLHAQQLTHR